MLKTKLTEKYGLSYPVMGAPMAMHSSAGLATAVSRAGGLGSFGGINPGGAEWVQQQIRTIRAETDRPFAVGFITAFIEGFQANFDVCLDEGVPLIVLSFGDPRPYAKQARAAGVPVACQVQTQEGARLALEAGAEFIVAQGNEAGGHGGYLNTLPCLSLVLEVAGDTPVLAAGGISDGRSLGAVLAAGAEGAVLGTALLATPEASDITDEVKQRIVESNGEDTIFSVVWDIISGAPWPSGIGNRTRLDDVVARWHGREEELREHLEEVRAELQSRPVSPVLMGQSAGFVKAVRPVASVMESICSSAEALLRKRSVELGL